MGAAVVTLAKEPLEYGTSRRMVFGTLHLSTSYAAGGDTFTHGQFGLEQIDMLVMDTATNPSAATQGIIFGWTPATTTGLTAGGKIQAFWAAGSATYLAEASGDLSAYTAEFMAIGW